MNSVIPIALMPGLRMLPRSDFQHGCLSPPQIIDGIVDWRLAIGKSKQRILNPAANGGHFSAWKGVFGLCEFWVSFQQSANFVKCVNLHASTGWMHSPRIVGTNRNDRAVRHGKLKGFFVQGFRPRLFSNLIEGLPRRTHASGFAAQDLKLTVPCRLVEEISLAVEF